MDIRWMHFIYINKTFQARKKNVQSNNVWFFFFLFEQKQNFILFRGESYSAKKNQVYFWTLFKHESIITNNYRWSPLELEPHHHRHKKLPIGLLCRLVWKRAISFTLKLKRFHSRWKIRKKDRKNELCSPVLQLH